MILADHGSPWTLSGVPSQRWNNSALWELRRLRGSDFEAVDTSSLIADPDSGRVAIVQPPLGGGDVGPQ
jgi:hypothetical protein